MKQLVELRKSFQSNPNADTDIRRLNNFNTVIRQDVDKIKTDMATANADFDRRIKALDTRTSHLEKVAGWQAEAIMLQSADSNLNRTMLNAACQVLVGNTLSSDEKDKLRESIKVQLTETTQVDIHNAIIRVKVTKEAIENNQIIASVSIGATGDSTSNPLIQDIWCTDSQL